jgi:hypothetical protein
MHDDEPHATSISFKARTTSSSVARTSQRDSFLIDNNEISNSSSKYHNLSSNISLVSTTLISVDSMWPWTTIERWNRIPLPIGIDTILVSIFVPEIMMPLSEHILALGPTCNSVRYLSRILKYFWFNLILSRIPKPVHHRHFKSLLKDSFTRFASSNVKKILESQAKYFSLRCLTWLPNTSCSISCLGKCEE